MLLLTALPLVPSVYGAESCDDKFLSSLHECERLVGSLRPDKMGQMRVYASDGSEFTAGQAMWMKAQLKRIADDCAGGNSADAAQRLTEVQGLLSEHHRAS
jgi:hypothetical protein